MSRWPLAWFPGRQRRLARLHRQPFLARPAEVWEHFRRCTLPVRAAGQLTRLLHQVDLTPVAMQIRQPVLLVCGDRDRVVPAADSEALLRALPSGGRVIIEGSGHIPTLTHPEALAGVVRAFLTPPEPGCPARQNLEVVREL
jgi:pimeloyl-ACP methyl ester carboxylesterase